MGSELSNTSSKIDNCVADVIFYFIKNSCSRLELLMISHLSKKFFVFVDGILKDNPIIYVDFLYDSIEKKYDNISEFLIKNHYMLSKNCENLAIVNSNFCIFSLIIAYKDYPYGIIFDESSIIASIKSGNIKMFNFIYNRTSNQNHDIILENAIIFDNLEVFEKLGLRKILCNENLVRNLVKFNSFKIIEYLQYKLTKPAAFEKRIYEIAVSTNNQIVIDYALDNNFCLS